MELGLRRLTHLKGRDITFTRTPPSSNSLADGDVLFVNNKGKGRNLRLYAKHMGRLWYVPLLSTNNVDLTGDLVDTETRQILKNKTILISSGNNVPYRSGDGTTDASIHITNQSNNHFKMSYDNDSYVMQTINSSGDLLFSPNDVEKIRFTATGNVGIGETSPDQILHIKGTNPQICIEENSTEFVRIGVEATSGDMCLGWDDSDDMHFGVFSSVTDTGIDAKMKIKSDGTILGLGKYGYNSTIRVLPNEFIMNDDGNGRYFYWVEDDNLNELSGRISSTGIEIYAFVTIPNGYTAKAVSVWADTQVVGAVEVLSYNHQTGATVSKGTGDTRVSGGGGTAINITDVDSSSTISLVIKVALGSITIDMFGAEIDIGET